MTMMIMVMQIIIMMFTKIELQHMDYKRLSAHDKCRPAIKV
jgi:hypothetical protein